MLAERAALHGATRSPWGLQQHSLHQSLLPGREKVRACPSPRFRKGRQAGDEGVLRLKVKSGPGQILQARPPSPPPSPHWGEGVPPRGLGDGLHVLFFAASRPFASPLSSFGLIVIPAPDRSPGQAAAGIHLETSKWTPAYAGVTQERDAAAWSHPHPHPLPTGERESRCMAWVMACMSCFC